MKKTAVFSILSLLILGSSPALAAIESFQIYSRGETETTLLEALKDVHPGDVVILGESHGTQVMADQQTQVLSTLRKQGLKVSLGMEFFERQQQTAVDAMRSGAISEAEFLSQIGWSSAMPYSAYRNQVNFPRYSEEFVRALNAPRALTSRISKVGISGLNEDEKAQLPVDFEIGNSAYYQRFQAVMGAHIPPEAIHRYFEAQSTWDDVMAFETVRFLKAHPEQVLVIIVGEFHVQYGGGLPSRILHRLSLDSGLSASRLKTFSLINLEGMSEDEREQSVRPSATDGSRADFVWTSQF
jgi:uncharacterized iron-regulated protein